MFHNEVILNFLSIFVLYLSRALIKIVVVVVVVVLEIRLILH